MDRPYRIATALPAAMLLCLSTALPAATLTVNSLADDTIVGNGQVTLREAIFAAQLDGPTDLGQNGAGADTIVANLDGGIALTAPLPTITTPVAIVGPVGAGLQVSAALIPGSLQRLFVVDGGALELTRLTLNGASVSGFGGGGCQQRSGCGGGSAGLGGIILLNAGSLAISESNLRNGSATGGSGGSRTLPAGSEGGGGGGGISAAGSGPSGGTGGIGGSGVPLSNAAGTPAAQPGLAGAGGGGGSRSAAAEPAAGGNGGYGGGGGGGGQVIGTAPSALGGGGGFGAGGGGRGGGNGVGADGPGGSGGAFGGAGGASTGFGNVAAGGGGGGGLGGCIFARAGVLEIARSSFENCLAAGGAAGSNNGNAGAPGQGKGGALFLADGVTAILAGVGFVGNAATDASGLGFIPGGASDTADVFGVARTSLFSGGFE